MTRKRRFPPWHRHPTLTSSAISHSSERAANCALKTSERSKCQTSTPTESGTSRSLLQRAIIADKIARRKSKSAPHRPFDAQIDDRPNQLSDLVRLPEPSFGTIPFSLWGPANFWRLSSIRIKGRQRWSCFTYGLPPDPFFQTGAAIISMDTAVTPYFPAMQIRCSVAR